MIAMCRRQKLWLRRGMSVFTAGDDEEQLSGGVYDAYTKRLLRSWYLFRTSKALLINLADYIDDLS